jgi:hypothetical protein
MRNFYNAQFDWWDLPLWRQAVIVDAFILFFVPGYTLFEKESTIYVSAPTQPNMSAKRIYPVHVNHGSLRYVSREEAESLAQWRTSGPILVAVAILAIAVTILTFERPSMGKASR